MNGSTMMTPAYLLSSFLLLLGCHFSTAQQFTVAGNATIVAAGQITTNAVNKYDDYFLDFSTVPNGRWNSRDYGLQWEFGGGAANANNTNFLFVTNGMLGRLPIGTPGVGLGWSNNPNADYFWRSNRGPITYAQLRFVFSTNAFSGSQFNANGGPSLGEAINISVKANNLGRGNGSLNISDNQFWFHLNLLLGGVQLSLTTNGTSGTYAGENSGWRRLDGLLDSGNMLYAPKSGDEWVSGYEVSADHKTIRVYHGPNSWTYSSPALTNIFWPGKTNSVWFELMAASRGSKLTNRYFTPMIKSWRFGNFRNGSQILK